MRNQSSVAGSIRYWWISLLSGILSVVVGVCCLVTPDATLVALSYLFVAMLLASGVMDILLSAANSGRLRGWGWMLVNGILELLLGLLLLATPVGYITQVLIFLVGLWILFRALWALGESYEFREYINTGWMTALAILAILFAFVFLLSPAWNGLFLVWLVSFAFFFYGIFRITHAFVLRSLR